ncbi:MAG: DUF4412 domain-containing protein [Flavobacteriales bacterium]|nr:DUF4412 domain-containing protein [Flavobacteriales bacterium]
MKHLILAFTFFITTLSTTFSQFQGTITMHTSNAAIAEQCDVIWKTKQAYHRMDMHSVSEQGTMNYTLFFEPGAAQCWMSSDGQTIEISAQYLQSAPVVHSFFMANPTGEEKNIAGYACQAYRLSAVNGYAICWVSAPAPEIIFPAIFKTQGILQGLQQHRINGTVLASYIYDLNNQPVYTYEISSIQTESLSESQVRRP